MYIYTRIFATWGRQRASFQIPQLIFHIIFIWSIPFAVTLKCTYNDAFFLAQLPQLRMFIIWQLVSTANAAHRQAIVQEHDNIQKLSTKR